MDAERFTSVSEINDELARVKSEIAEKQVIVDDVDTSENDRRAATATLTDLNSYVGRLNEKFQILSRSTSTNDFNFTVDELVHLKKNRNLQIKSSRPDALNDEEVALYVKSLVDFMKMNFTYDPAEEKEMARAFYISVLSSAVNQSTVARSRENKHLLNTFVVNDKTFKWYKHEFLNYLLPIFPGIENPERRFMRSKEQQVFDLINYRVIEVDNSLGAKHGVTTQFRDHTGDYMTGCCVGLTIDQLAANLKAKKVALEGSNSATGGNRIIHNVTDLVGR